MKKRFVEVEVDFCLAKGEAEMNSWNAVAVVAERMLSRLGQFSLLTFMILSLAMGTPAIAADEDFKLWSKKDDKALEYIQEDDSTKAVKWMVEKPDAQKFVESFSEQPIVFAQGFRAGLQEAIKTKSASELKTFKSEMLEKFNAIEAKAFGGRLEQAALKGLIEKMLEMDEDQLKDEDFLKKLFEGADEEEKEALLAILNLTDEDPKADDEDSQEKPEEKPEEKPAKPVLEDEANKNAGDDLSEQVREQFGNQNQNVNNGVDPEIEASLKAEQARNAQMQQIINSLRAQGQPAATGEFNDAALQKTAKIVCDKLDALDRNLSNDLEDQIKPLQDALNEGFNRIAALSSRPVEAQQQNNGGQRLEDILPGLLANALDSGEEQAIQPPPPPQVAAQIPPQEENDDDNGLFNQLPPELPEQPIEEPQGGLPFIPQPTRQAVQQPINLDLPSTSGRLELREAEDTLANLENRTPIAQTLQNNASLPDLVMAKAKVSSEAKQAQATLQTAQDKAAVLDEQLEQLKEGGRAALPASVKRREAEMQNDVKGLQRQLEQFQQVAAQAGDNPQAQQAAQQRLQQLQGQLNQAEDTLNNFRAEKEIKIEEGNKAIKSLAKQRDRLNSAISKLKGQVGTLKEEETAVQQLINTQVNLQMQAIQAQYNPQAAGGVTPNVNRIQQFGSSTGNAPRSNLPSQLNTLGSSIGSSSLSTGSSVPTSTGVTR